MRKIFLFLIGLCVALQIVAQQKSLWTMHLAYHDATLNVPAREQIYALYEGNLLSYRPTDQSVRLWSKLNGLSGKEIWRISYSATQHCLVIVYEDGNIDLLYDKGTLVHLPQYAQKERSQQTFNDLDVQGRWAILSTSSGVLIIDIEKQEIKGFYDLKANIASATCYKEQVYIVKNDYCQRISIFDNLIDETRWTRIAPVQAHYLRSFAGQLWACSASGISTLALTPASATAFTPFSRLPITQVAINADHLVAMSDAKVLVIESKAPQKVQYEIDRLKDWQYVSMNQGKLWVSEGTNGLQAYRLRADKWEKDGTAIGGYGPIKDMCYYLSYAGNRLLVGGGFLDYSGKMHPPVAMAYENGKWYNFETKDVAEKTGVPYRNVTSVVQDPKDEHHHFVSATTGLYEYRNYRFVKHYTINNSPLRSASGTNKGYVFTDGLIYDAHDNLWVLNNQVDTLLQVFRSNAKWKGIDIASLEKAPTLEKTLFDHNGRLWVTSRRTVSYHTSGVLCYDDKGTLNNTKDDIYKYRSSAINEDGQSVDIGGFYSGVYSIAEDVKGKIWIGAGTGVFVVENPEDWFSSNFVINQPKVPRNDGTNYADYLLKDVPVSAIAVDPANRKWLGTYGSGLYLVNADGTEILQHFTIDNSPLLSNTIYALAINAESGEVMIGTDKGLCSYQGYATQAQPSLDKSQIKVFPNPIEPNFRGNVKITGLTENADIRIVTVNGEAVAGGRSLGGSFEWNLMGTNGRRVASGVYYIMVVTQDANQGVVAKVLVI